MLRLISALVVSTDASPFSASCPRPQRRYAEASVDGSAALVDEVVPEPLGGAHNDHDAMADTLRDALLRNLNELEQIDPGIHLQERYAKYRRHGKYIEG